MVLHCKIYLLSMRGGAHKWSPNTFTFRNGPLLRIRMCCKWIWPLCCSAVLLWEGSMKHQWNHSHWMLWTPQRCPASSSAMLLINLCYWSFKTALLWLCCFKIVKCCLNCSFPPIIASILTFKRCMHGSLHGFARQPLICPQEIERLRWISEALTWLSFTSRWKGCFGNVQRMRGRVLLYRTCLYGNHLLRKSDPIRLAAFLSGFPYTLKTHKNIENAKGAALKYYTI